MVKTRELNQQVVLSELVKYQGKVYPKGTWGWIAGHAKVDGKLQYKIEVSGVGQKYIWVAAALLKTR